MSLQVSALRPDSLILEAQVPKLDLVLAKAFLNVKYAFRKFSAFMCLEHYYLSKSNILILQSAQTNGFPSIYNFNQLSRPLCHDFHIS